MILRRASPLTFAFIFLIPFSVLPNRSHNRCSYWVVHPSLATYLLPKRVSLALHPEIYPWILFNCSERDRGMRGRLRIERPAVEAGLPDGLTGRSGTVPATAASRATQSKAADTRD